MTIWKETLGSPSQGSEVHSPAGLGVSANAEGAAGKNYSYKFRVTLLSLLAQSDVDKWLENVMDGWTDFSGTEHI